MSPFVQVETSDKIEKRIVRYRTVGDMTCTAAVEGKAYTIDQIEQEILTLKLANGVKRALTI